MNGSPYRAPRLVPPAGPGWWARRWAAFRAFLDRAGTAALDAFVFVLYASTFAFFLALELWLIWRAGPLCWFWLAVLVAWSWRTRGDL